VLPIELTSKVPTVGWVLSIIRQLNYPLSGIDEWVAHRDQAPQSSRQKYTLKLLIEAPGFYVNI